MTIDTISRTNWIFAGNKTVTGENSSVETTWQRERKLVTVFWHTVICFKRAYYERQGLDSVWFRSKFILVHVEKRHDLQRTQLRNRHAFVYVIKKALQWTSLSTIERVVLLFPKSTIT